MTVTLSERQPVARKAHQCLLCYRDIEPGERYHAQNNVFDGRAYTWRECAHCHELLLIVPRLMEACDEGYSWETIADWEPKDEAEVDIKRRWRAQWRRADGTLGRPPNHGPDLTDRTDVEAWLDE